MSVSVCAYVVASLCQVSTYGKALVGATTKAQQSELALVGTLAKKTLRSLLNQQWRSDIVRLPDGDKNVTQETMRYLCALLLANPSLEAIDREAQRMGCGRVRLSLIHILTLPTNREV